MKARSTFNLKVLAFVALCSSVAGCTSYSSIMSSEGIWGTSLGAAAGVGGGYLLGQEVGKETENMLLLGGIGAGLGALSGGLLHDENVKSSQKKLAVVREARLIGENQREIDHLRQALEDSSIWGQTEVKPWDQRYVIDEDAGYDVYQGPTPK